MSKLIGFDNTKSEFNRGEMKYRSYYTLLGTSLITGYSCEFLSGGFITNEQAQVEVINELTEKRKLVTKQKERIKELEEKLKQLEGNV